ncbi:MAG: phosphoglycerate mutase family protein [Defluviitaleaceae bacterium]|nr:phosphoglycerate mutase family protein [Defluviitaleaceae bacterium]
MLKIIFMRHSETDYSFVEAKCYIGHGCDLGQLTDNGILIAEKASLDSRLDGSELIVSSPYTRALQTAAIISKNRQLNIKIELDLHEWIRDLTFGFCDKKLVDKAIDMYMMNKGICPEDSEVKYESIDALFGRAKNSLLKYMDYEKIIVVTHGVLMHRFVSADSIPYCGIYEIEFDESFTCKMF